MTPPSFVHRAAPSPLPGRPAGLSADQASGHVDHFTRSRGRPRWEGAAATCTHTLEGALFWKEALRSGPESGFQGARRPRPGVPQSLGAVAPAPGFRCPSGAGSRLSAPASGPGALPVGCQPRSDVAARNLGDDIAPKERTVDHSYGFRVPVEFGFLWE